MKSRARIEGAKRMLCYYMPPNPALQLTRAVRGALGRARHFDEQNRSIEVGLSPLTQHYNQRCPTLDRGWAFFASLCHPHPSIG
jgi:hypothetical protein